MSPFCDNEQCLYHKIDADDEQVEVDVDLPDGKSIKLYRSILKFPNGGAMNFCTCCQGAMRMPENKAIMAESLSYRPKNFCANDQCWLHAVEVDDPSQVQLTLTLGESEYQTARDFLKYPDGKVRPICLSCRSAIAYVANMDEWPMNASNLKAKDSRIIVPTF